MAALVSNVQVAIRDFLRILHLFVSQQTKSSSKAGRAWASTLKILTSALPSWWPCPGDLTFQSFVGNKGQA